MHMKHKSEIFSLFNQLEEIFSLIYKVLIYPNIKVT